MMRRIFLLGVVVHLLVSFSASGHPSPIQVPADPDRDPEDRERGVIMGRILAEDGGTPLAKATLTLRSKDARPEDQPWTVRTDSRGEYTIRNVKAGQYVLRATRNGYIPRNYGQKTSYSFRRFEEVGTALTVDAGQVLDGIDVHLIRAGVVEGRVVDQDHEPLERVAVMLSHYRSPGRSRGFIPFGRGVTDDQGRFRLSGIPPGSYVLGAAAFPSFAQKEGGGWSFPPTYYPGVLSADEAVPVQVSAGAEVGGFDITLIEALSYSVSGRVLTPEGKPAHSVMVMSLKESSTDILSMIGQRANTDLQGGFVVPGLLPGRYRLSARVMGGKDAQMASATVGVADQDLSGLTLVLGKGAEMSGTIVTERKDTVLDWRRVQLSMESVGSFGSTRASLEEDFSFKIANLPDGPYHLVVKLPQGNHYVSSIRVEGKDITDRPIEMRINDQLTGVEIHVSSEGAGISGYVEKAEEREVAEGATVLVFAADPRHRGSFSRFTRTKQTDQSGRFSLEGLVPAEYLVCALADHEAGREMDLDYLRTLEKDSERIDLSPGQTAHETLVALPTPRMN